MFDDHEIPLKPRDGALVVGEDGEVEDSFVLTIALYRGFLRFGDICEFQPVTAIAHAEHLIQTLLMLGDTQQGVESPFNLLEDPSNLLEPFIAAGSRGIMSTDIRRARMLINSLKICCRIGVSHKILNDIDAANSESELERLSDLLVSFNN